jgi:nitroreductase
MNKLLSGSICLFTLLTACQPKSEAPVLMPKDAVIENLLTRRSIRKYTEQQVTTGQIDTLLKSAVFAPSAMNLQPWIVRVVQRQSILDEINRRGNFGRNVFHSAPTVIFVGKDTTNFYSAFDCGLLTENILLAAHALELGTCPIGGPVALLNAPENKDLLQQIEMPESHSVIICIALGYPAESPQPKERDFNKVKIID